MFEAMAWLGILGLAILGIFAWAHYRPMNEDDDGKWTR